MDFTESMNENQITKLSLEQSRQALVQACKSGDVSALRKLASVKSHGLDLVNFKCDGDLLCNTPLHLACASGHFEIAELLIRKLNARVNEVNKLG